MLGDGCPLASQGHKGKTWHDSLLHCQWGPPIKHFFWALGQRSGEKRGIYASLHLNPRQNPKRQLSLTKRSLLITRSSSSNAAEARKYPSPLSFPESNKKKTPPVYLLVTPAMTFSQEKVVAVHGSRGIRLVDIEPIGGRRAHLALPSSPVSHPQTLPEAGPGQLRRVRV